MLSYIPESRSVSETIFASGSLLNLLFSICRESIKPAFFFSAKRAVNKVEEVGAGGPPGSGVPTLRQAAGNAQNVSQKNLKSEPAAQLPGTVFDVEFAAGIMELVYKSVEFFKMKPDFLHFSYSAVSQKQMLS